MARVSGSNPERLTHFARCHAIAICDDVRSHSGATLAITTVNMLNHFFALVAAGQIEIDVGPFTAFFGKKTLEEQLHADGIDGGDAQRITNSAIGGRSAALDKNILLAAEADQIPDDQEISGEFEFLDQF